MAIESCVQGNRGTWAVVRLLQVREVANSVSQKREMEMRTLKDKLEDKLQRIQHPGSNLKRFDLVITPRHDYYPLTVGALHQSDPIALLNAASSWHDNLAPLPKPLFVVNIGGPTKIVPVVKSQLAIDVTLDKKSVKQTGDAWRIVLDSCLPVIHLIETRRSVPYSVKQVQELFGISCAFEQAIQVDQEAIWHPTYVL